MKNLLLMSLMAVLLLPACKEKSCSNGKQDKNETGIDCGGDCAPCETCSDGILNQDEIAVDCGGVCSPCPIEYPAAGTYGNNVLGTSTDTLHLSQAEYSFKAIIPEGSTLKIKLSSVSGGSWWYNLGANSGWSITEFTAGVQWFEALGSTCQVNLDLSSMTGIFQVWYYENGESLTRVGVVSVE